MKFPCCTLRGREGRFLGTDISFLFPLETSHVRKLSPIPLVVDASGARTRKAPGSPGMSVCGHGDVTPPPLAAITQPRLATYTPRIPSSFLLFFLYFCFHPSRLYHTRYLTASPAHPLRLGGAVSPCRARHGLAGGAARDRPRALS